uniref:Uncharacterized protein n=1 Tax=Anguilla anguilla TaxID=7936 RepID=A0A0E9TS23_ANGAN
MRLNILRTCDLCAPLFSCSLVASSQSRARPWN